MITSSLVETSPPRSPATSGRSGRFRNRAPSSSQHSVFSGFAVLDDARSPPSHSYSHADCLGTGHSHCARRVTPAPRYCQVLGAGATTRGRRYFQRRQAAFDVRVEPHGDIVDSFVLDINDIRTTLQKSKAPPQGRYRVTCGDRGRRGQPDRGPPLPVRSVLGPPPRTRPQQSLSRQS